MTAGIVRNGMMAGGGSGGSSPKFKKMPADDKPFARAFQEAVSELERITPADKGQCVPFLKIWQIQPESGKPFYPDESGLPKRPLSSQMVEPPLFGVSTDAVVRFRERPAVSLERVVIKYVNPREIFSWRQFQMNFTVHRPDVVFEESKNGEDVWSSLLIPGNTFALEYGWISSRGVKNSLLNGDGLLDDVSKVVFVPAIQSVRFTVTVYNFKIDPNNEMSFTIDALEDGEFNFRQAVVGMQSIAGVLLDPGTWNINEPFGRDTKQMKILRDAFHNKLSKSKKKTTSKSEMVAFSDVFDLLFAPLFDKAYTNLGYDKKELFIGGFNARSGQPIPRFAKESSWIGDFKLPLQDVENIFSKNLAIGDQITLQNFMKPFLDILGSDSTWDRTSSKKDNAGDQMEMVPRIVVRSVTNKDRDNKRSVAIYIFDAKHEFISVTANNKDKSADFIGTNGSKDDLRNKLKDKKVPFISIMKGNSYIRESNFTVALDDKIKSLMIRKVFGEAGTRVKFTGQPEIDGRVQSAPNAAKFIYSGAIMGDITMIGNFAFDIFSLIWIDFGIPVWDGMYTIMEREDTIERGDFTTKIKVKAEGTDPFGIQGRNKGPVSNTPRGQSLKG